MPGIAEDLTRRVGEFVEVAHEVALVLAEALRRIILNRRELS